jgi:tetratricopeptide (TPR) repeat protein
MAGKKLAAFVAFVFALSLPPFARAAETVRIWEEPLVIPTYLVETPDPNPIFYFGRAYQGARGPVYPYPFLDRLTDRKVDKSYRAVCLENEYLKICVLPELGGRIFSAVDKTNGYEFVYHQHVIKPALIGMLGAWISGGVEWNIPHHHRATTFMEVDSLLERGPDGSATVWIGEIELRDRMKWIVGLTLRPGRSSLEVTTKVLNRTALAHSMLAFANVAVHANPEYQVIFPPDVELATFHSKNQFSRWPWSTEFFNGQDYSKGVDVSWWKSHAYPTSFFAWEAKGDFLAGYDHGKEAGIVFVGDHNFVPGKKLWTWGTGSDGRLWEKILTDADGPYAELMVGAYSDNQPDYSWISPYEVRAVTQQWYPVRGIGGIKAANEEAAIDLSVLDGGKARLGLYTTTERPAIRAVLRAGSRTLFEDAGPASPRGPFVRTVPLPAGTREEDLSIVFLTPDGKEIISYRPPKRATPPLPPPYAPPAPPKDIPTIEGLYLAGLRIEQFCSAAFEPEPYYEEALRRDPGDYRANTALGLLLIKRARYAEAENHLRRAVERAEGNDTRPKDGEALYYLGVALRAQGKNEDAGDAFNRAAWTQAWRSAAFTQLAELAASDGQPGKALSYAVESLKTNALNGQILGLRASLLRRLGRGEEARSALGEMRPIDPMDLRAAFESTLLATSGGLNEDVGRLQAEMRGLLRDSPANLLELAADYARGGLWDDAVSALKVFTGEKKKGAGDFPLLHYFQAYARDKAGDGQGASSDLRSAAALPPDFGFPFQSEFVDILGWAMAANPKDARAPYYLGNFLFDRQPEEAMRLWSVSAGLEPRFATALRNLGIGAWRIRKDFPDAQTWLEKAVAADPSDPRLFLELDQVSELNRVPAERRLALLEKNHAVVTLRDDALGREIQLLVLLGRHERAIELLKSHHFRVWEGGGNIHGAFAQAYLMRGREAMEAHRFGEALEAFKTAMTYPLNLEAAEPRGGPGSAKVFYHIGTAQEALGDRKTSEEAFHKAISFRSGRSEDDYYRGLALAKIGRADEAGAIFEGLIRAGKERAGSGPAPGAQAYFLQGLGYLGKGREIEAAEAFEKARALDLYDPEIRFFQARRSSVR